MKNPFLTNKSLIRFIKILGLKDEDKSFLISKVPDLDESSRLKLFNALKEIYFIDLEENEELKK